MNMPRFYFHVHNDIDAKDEQGITLADLAAAKQAAIEGARAMMAEHVTKGRPVTLHHRIDVADESGKVLASLPFRELITIVG